MSKKNIDQIEIHEDKRGIASPDGAISFLLCIFALIDGYSNIVNISNDELFSIGAVQTLLSFGAFVAALINIFRGKARGNINMLATILLGLFPGLTKLIIIFSAQVGVVFDDYLFGIVYILGSIFCGMVAFKRIHRPAYRFFGTLSLSIGFLLDGLGTLNHLGELIKVSGWFYFVFAVEMYYFGLTIMYFYNDARLPQGHSFIHWLHHFRKHEK